VRVWRDFSEVPSDLGRTAVTIGNFDGMHLGHQHVVRRAREVAGEVGVDHVVAVTFDPHPIAVLRPEHAPPTLTTIEERLQLLHEAGVDDVLVIPFSRDIAAWTPHEFIDRILLDTLHVRAVVVGANFRFGNRAAGDCNLLRAVGAEHDFVLEEVTLDGGPQVWSSTYVRTCLAAGDVVAPPRRWAARSRPAARSSRATSVGASSATRPPTSGSARARPRPPTACTPAG